MLDVGAAGPAGALPLAASQRAVLQEGGGPAERGAALSQGPGQDQAAAVI